MYSRVQLDIADELDALRVGGTIQFANGFVVRRESEHIFLMDDTGEVLTFIECFDRIA